MKKELKTKTIKEAGQKMQSRISCPAFFVLNKAAEPPLFRKFLPVSTLSSPRLLNESLSHDQLPV